jgi:hypothetical protein
MPFAGIIRSLPYFPHNRIKVKQGTITGIPEKITGPSGQDCYRLLTLPNWFSTNPCPDKN